MTAPKHHPAASKKLALTKYMQGARRRAKANADFWWKFRYKARR